MLKRELTPIVILLAMIVFGGCHTVTTGSGTAKPTTPELIRDTSARIADISAMLPKLTADVTLVSGWVLAQPAAPADVKGAAGALPAEVGNVKTATDGAATAVKGAEAGAAIDAAAGKKLADENAKLKAADPVRTALEWTDYGCFAFGALLVVLYLLSDLNVLTMTLLKSLGDNLLAIGIGLLVLGCLLYVLLMYLAWIVWGTVAAVVIAGGVWYYTRSKARAATAALAPVVPAPATGK